MNTRPGATILLADDEVRICAVWTRALTNAGYRALVACDGAEAVSVFRQHRDEIALVTLDVVMPRMNGLVACVQIRELAPTVPVLFMTGYSPLIELPAETRAAYTVLTKPCNIDILLATIERMLQKPQTPLPNDAATSRASRHD